MQIDTEILTTGDVARRLDCSPDYVRQLVRAGRLPVLLTRSGQRLFFFEDVERLAEDRAAKHGKVQDAVSEIPV
jgi:excisionase family DNA binding protein